jgi:hypothetical protein
MINNTTNELNRAVILLNFEKENMGNAKNVLIKKYKIPHYYIYMLLHKIFHRLGTYNLSLSATNSEYLWDQFHTATSEELNALNLNLC